MGETVTFRGNGEDVSGYLARPKGGKGPGIVVIQEWWGLVPHIESIADRLAAEGYLALAPDLYHGQKTTEPNEAQKMMQALDLPHAVKDMSGAVDFLLADEAHQGDRLGSIGFCLGGRLSLLLAAARPEIKACVAFYPAGIPTTDYEKVQGAILVHFAEHDDSTPPDAVQRLGDELTRQGKRHVFHTYAGTHHAFFNDTRPAVYRADAADLAWTRTLGFFQKELR